MTSHCRTIAWLLASLAIFGVPLRGQTGTALVRHAPTLNGSVNGSVQQMTAEAVSFNSGSTITNDLLVPGTPAVRLNGSPTYGGAIIGIGSPSPSNYQVTINSGAKLGHLRTCTDPIVLPLVAAPPLPTGTRNISINSVGQNAGDFTTLHNLTLNSNVGQFIVPAGVYGDFTANGGSGFTLGVSGGTSPSVYAFQHLTLNSSSQLNVIGPVTITIANGSSFNSSAGNSAHPEWLTLQFSAGGLTLNSSVILNGSVIAPNGIVTINSNGQLLGNLACDRLTINSTGLLQLLNTNVPPIVSLISPANNMAFDAPASFTLQATASDSDGTVAQVSFYQGSTLLGQSNTAPYQFSLSALAVGTYSFTAQATDNSGAVTSSASVNVQVNALPSVSLSGPPPNVPLAAPTSIILTAGSSNADGTIARVEFYRGGVLVGTVSSPSTGTSNYTFADSSVSTPGIYSYKARTYDNLGGYADSAILSVTVLAGLPYLADFETSEGYSLGALSGQLGWTASQGSPLVTASDALSGSQSIVLPASSPTARVTQTFAPLSGENVLFVDLFAKPAADADVTAAATFTAESSRFAFLSNDNHGLLEAFDGDGSGGGSWLPTSFSLPLNAQQQAADWIRLTARLDFSTKTWDLYAAGNMVAADLGFRDITSTTLTSFEIQGHAANDTLFDDFMAGPDNPLFADVNKNGIDDAWETAHGLSLSNNNRALSPSGSGLTVLQAYLRGTDPNDYFNGQTPSLSIAGGNNQTAASGTFNLQPLSVVVRNAVGTTSLANAPVTFTVTQGGGGVALSNANATTSSANLTVRTGADGTAQVYFQQPATASTVGQINAVAGTAQVTFQTVSADPDYYHGIAPTLVSLQDDSGELSSDGALSVLVKGADGGPLSGAPVTFTAQGNDHLLATTAEGAGFVSVIVWSNSQGIARAYVVSIP